jgi:hypothetical protein
MNWFSRNPKTEASTAPSVRNQVMVAEVEESESIARVPLRTIPGREFGELLALGIEAKRVLGYSALEADVRLKNALSELEIEVLNLHQVHAYQEKIKSESHAPWKWTAIDKYTLPIPEFVLNKAIQIKKRLPDASLEIVHQGPAMDPFLWVGLNGEGYYVEVWDEPEFESEYL